MSIIEDEFAYALDGTVKRKANNTRDLRSKAAKVASGVPEVMAKVTGFGRGAAHVKAHLTYITRHGEVEMENESGQIFKGKKEVGELFAEWVAEIGESARRKNQRDTMHLVLSMPETVDSVSVHEAVREFTQKTFSKNHDYVFALHTDTAHPHCHVTVKMMGYNGRCLKTEKADLQSWRDGFAEAMQLQGVEAAATPRRSRGVVKKAEKSVIRHIERGDEKRPPRVPRVKAQLIIEVADELTAKPGTPFVNHPWEARIKARQQAVRAAWLNAAAALEKPKAPVVFKKEIKNEQPQYDRIDATTIRRVQLSAGIYQSCLKDAGPAKPATTISGLRNLSSLPLVQSQGTTQMLLHAHARPDMGHVGRGPSAAGDGLRRAGTGLDGFSRSDGAGDHRGVTSASRAALAAQIRDFVSKFPSVETAREATRRQLSARFGKQANLSSDASSAVQPLTPERDLER